MQPMDIHESCKGKSHLEVRNVRIILNYLRVEHPMDILWHTKKVLILPPLGEWLLWDANLCQIMSELKQEMERSQSLGYIWLH